MSAFGYVSPETLEEAVGALASRPEARVLAGGHTLLLRANQERIAGSLLVDLKRVAGLRGIELQSEGNISIGAMTTLASIASDELVRKSFPALAEAAEAIGDAQLRNRATLGGSLAGLDPEADLPALMLALGADVHVVGIQGRRSIPAEEFFIEAGRTALKRDELIASVVIPPLPECTGAAYVRLKHPARLFAVCGVAAVVTVVDGRITNARVAVTGALNHPSRLYKVERALQNGSGTEKALMAAAAASDEGNEFRGDLYASPDYREHLTRVFTGRALKQALARAAA